jgi:hypothetical protein
LLHSQSPVGKEGVGGTTYSSRLGFPLAPCSDDCLQIGAPRFDFAEVCESQYGWVFFLNELRDNLTLRK